MSNLIDKAALVAEIERLRALLPDAKDCNYLQLEFARGQQDAFTDFEEFVNTLEAKEVDLEQEYKDFVEEDPVYNKLVNGIVGKAIAKHFFELGLKVAQKGE